ncbi:hypothetical protein Ga0080574_TMP1835 [Salipiger abyssi]|uniref:Uncharacterized protein n=2 Tax=Salipiger abyssi TaxID=1250539 RepID=A0A1P8URZ3_9RHOB|nr:hypothetical protein Ga0080574_TMP1835 [Salipiger abyssi]
MMLPQAVVSDQPWNENMLEEIMSSANDLCNSLTPHLGYHEYVVVKDAKVQRLLDALRAIPIDDYGDACTGREGYPET